MKYLFFILSILLLIRCNTQSYTIMEKAFSKIDTIVLASIDNVPLIADSSYPEFAALSDQYSISDKMEGEKELFRIFILNPFSNEKNKSFHNVKIFEFVKAEREGYAKLYNFQVRKNNDTSLTTKDAYFLKLRPKNGWKNFFKDIAWEDINKIREEEIFQPQYDLFGTVVVLEKDNYPENISLDFSYGYNLVRPNNQTAKGFVSLLNLIENEFGIRLTRLTDSIDLLDPKIYQTESTTN